MELILTEVHDVSRQPKGTFKSLRDWKRSIASMNKTSRSRDDIFAITDPEGVVHRIDFSQWAHADAGHVFLRIGFRTRNPSFGKRRTTDLAGKIITSR